MRATDRQFITPWFGKCLLLLALCGAGQGQATDLAAQIDLAKAMNATPATRSSALAEGKANSSFCANCHGVTGISKYPEVPNLAGQNPNYLLTQMMKFETGARKDDFMQRLIKVLGDRERATVALYYSDAPVIPSVAIPGPMASKGAAHFNKLCARCHGEQARGMDVVPLLPGEQARGAEIVPVPRIAGQQAKYLRISFDRYRSGSGERVYALMTGATSQIPAADVDAVIDYIASLK
ncbi:c-type cytochrome [Propionivibrio sp.]|uniref:c-type cytochrome n=1 Tax=Propionivibrio sp. TaxID=2212460 RepID=UPI003BF34FDD